MSAPPALTLRSLVISRWSGIAATSTCNSTSAAGSIV